MVHYLYLFRSELLSHRTTFLCSRGPYPDPQLDLYNCSRNAHFIVGGIFWKQGKQSDPIYSPNPVYYFSFSDPRMTQRSYGISPNPSAVQLTVRSAFVI